MKPNETRERIRVYIAKHPRATYREIMAACDVSSTSLVSYHLGKMDQAAAACPVCQGTGSLPEPHEHGRTRASEKKAMAKTLRAAASGRYRISSGGSRRGPPPQH